MAGTVIPYKHGVMELNGNVLQKWQSGNLNIDTPKTEVKVMAEGGIVDGFVSGPAKCNIDVENSIPVDGTEEDYVNMAIGATVLTFKFTVGNHTLSAQGYLTSVKFSDSPDAQPKCNFSAACAAPTWDKA
jgi:hypothetical protein